MPPRRKRGRPSAVAAGVDAASESASSSAVESPVIGVKSTLLTAAESSSSRTNGASSGIVTTYTQLQSRLETELQELVNGLTQRRFKAAASGQALEALEQKEMDALVTALYERLPLLVDNRRASPADLPSTQKARFDLQRSIVSSTLQALVSSAAYPSSGSPLFTAPDAVRNQLVHDSLDVSLTFVEREWSNTDTTLITLEEILETAGVEEAERAFSYLETRVKRLTKDMVPERGNSLTFLRMQNSLLRRLSKSIHTVFCGRILAFLASVFPIAERSGVNLRGAFNTGNTTLFEQDPPTPSPPPKEEMDVDVALETNGKQASKSDDGTGSEDRKVDAMQVDAADARSEKEDGEEDSPETQESAIDNEAEKAKKVKKAEEEKAIMKRKAEAEAVEKAARERKEFYGLFWSLQGLLSNPPDLFKGYKTPPAGPVAALVTGSSKASPSSSSSIPQTSKPSGEEEASPSTPNLATLREGIAKTLKVFSATTEKELELGGKQGEKGNARDSGANIASISRSLVMDIDHANEDQVKEHYFFPKYLTKRNLLNLEVADPYFRRQVLTQFLIVLGYIRSFSLDERNMRASLPRANKALEPVYGYEARDDAWVKPLLGQVWKAIDSTPPNGSLFSRTIQQIIKRDNNWALWKAASCQSFTKNPLKVEDLEKAKTGFRTVTSHPPQNRHRVGTEALTKLWDQKVTAASMSTIDPKKGVPDLAVYLQMIQKADSDIESRKMDLELERKDAAAIAKDPEILEIEERKTSLSWRALRIAQSSYLQHFKEIGLGDFEKLMKAVNKAEEEKKSRQAKAVAAKKDASSDAAGKVRDSEGEGKEAGGKEGDEEIEDEVAVAKDEEDDAVAVGAEKSVEANGSAALTNAEPADVMDIDKAAATPDPLDPSQQSETPKRQRSEDAVSEGSSAKKQKV